MPRTCWFDRRALAELRTEARRWRLRETGGALLGWRNDTDIVVARILGPGPLARHGLSSFEPDADWQNSEGARVYHESGRTIAYLGDWHTHPRGKATPSPQDRRTLEQIAKDTAFRAPNAIYAIAAQRLHRPWRLALWEWRDSDLQPLPIRLFDLGPASEIDR